MHVADFLQIGAVVVALIALLAVRRIGSSSDHAAGPARDAEEGGAGIHSEPSSPASRPPTELVAAWVQFLRTEVADAANGLNNRLAAIAALTRRVSRRRLSPDHAADLDQVETEIQRATAITRSLLHRVDSFAPETVPESYRKLQAASVAPAAILVVDDDAVNRQVIVHLLTRLGHRVTPAGDGREAFTALDDNDFDCVICDVQMLSLGGRGLFEQIEERKPNVASRFVFVTGDFTRPETRAFLDRTGCPVIPKPYDADALMSAVAAILAQRRTTTTPPGQTRADDPAPTASRPGSD